MFRFHACIIIVKMLMDDLKHMGDIIVSVILYSNSAHLVLEQVLPVVVIQTIDENITRIERDLYGGTHISASICTFEQCALRTPDGYDITFVGLTDGIPTIGICRHLGLSIQMETSIANIKSQTKKEPFVVFLGISNEADIEICQAIAHGSSASFFQHIKTFDELAGVVGSLSTIIQKSSYITVHGKKNIFNSQSMECIRNDITRG
jgi:hypothetical protein